jgi:MFS transporter, DHA1 family, multidrug resistance protein
MPDSNRGNLLTLFFVMVVAMLGFGMIIPILPFYIEHMGAGGLELGLLMAIFSVMQLVCAPVWGTISDRVGRKPVLLTGVFGSALSLVLFGLSTELWMLFAARALSGVLSSAMLPTAMAYIGDSTSQRDRGSGMGVMGAAMGLGMVIGPGMGGWLAGFSLALPFFVGAALTLAAMVPIQLFLPESLPQREAGRPAGQTRWVGPRALVNSLSGPLGVLMLMAFLVNFGLTAFQGVFGLFALERFSYGPQQVGTVLMLFGVVSAVVQGVLAGWLIRRWGEVALLRGSLLVSAVGYVGMLLAFDYLSVLLTTGFFALGTSLLLPIVASLTSRRAVLGQGATMGLSNSFMSLGRTIGPLLAGFFFDIDLRYPYMGGALVMLVGLLVSLLWLSEAWESSEAREASVPSAGSLPK